MDEEEACNNTNNGHSYKGVRKRKWGKWVSEIREPGTKTRIWLGSYDTPEMAAAAYDVAAFHFKGRYVRLNFPELVEGFPRPASSRAEDVRLAAHEAAMRFAPPRAGDEAAGVPQGLGEVRVGLSASEIEAINETPMDSPCKMWMEVGLVKGPEDYDWAEMQSVSIWDY
ncbi:unnamed protein product [Cuscuta campestris]|uniref:AP2/ERF domain-containing protein n=1 Tax=Cuscuta campestris TaxID=132261 RepID=A0A484L592_9ASTE|nr:unnamed protein product [Cuscuta campestris]